MIGMRNKPPSGYRPMSFILSTTLYAAPVNYLEFIIYYKYFWSKYFNYPHFNKLQAHLTSGIRIFSALKLRLVRSFLKFSRN